MRKLTIFALLLMLVSVVYSQSEEATASPELQKLQREILNTDTPFSTPGLSAGQPAEQAKEILSNPLYRESLDTSQGESWLAKALENLFEKVAEWFSDRFNKEKKEPTGGFGAAPGLIQGMIAILIAVLAGFLIFMLAQIRLKRKPSVDEEDGLISNEEAKRSADQWIREADRLASEGLFREAIRCLYLACLIRMDEQRILRFERHETNWEHLLRFRDLPSKPGTFDLHPATQKFDHAWYGLIPQDQNDVNWFKSEYQLLLDGLRQAKQ